jgi:hypothetical protein
MRLKMSGRRAFERLRAKRNHEVTGFIQAIGKNCTDVVDIFNDDCASLACHFSFLLFNLRLPPVEIHANQ